MYPGIFLACPLKANLIICPKITSLFNSLVFIFIVMTGVFRLISFQSRHFWYDLLIFYLFMFLCFGDTLGFFFLLRAFFCLCSQRSLLERLETIYDAVDQTSLAISKTSILSAVLSLAPGFSVVYLFCLFFKA